MRMRGSDLSGALRLEVAIVSTAIAILRGRNARIAIHVVHNELVGISGSADVMQDVAPPMSFGRVISDARKRLDKSQKEIAERVGISPQYLNDLERNRRNPPANLLDEFATNLKLPREFLDYVAGQLPPELRGVEAKPEQVEAAFKAFRKKLEATKG